MPLYDLSFIIGTSDSDLEYGYDEDWTYVGIHPWGYASKDNYHRDRKTASYEWRLVSNSDSALFNDTTAWVMGFYGLESKEDLLRQYTYLADNYTSSYDFDTNAFYAQLDTKLSATWSITTGIRFESRTADYVTSDGLRLSSDETHSSGRISLQHNTDNLMTYITLARGNKAGGFNTDGTLDPALREFNPECLTEVEVGIKGYFLDGNLALRLALFHADRTDQQVKSSLVITRPDGSTEFVDFLDNAADGTNQGMEAEIQWYPANNLEISAALGYLKATFDSYVNEFGDDLSGRRQAHAPDYTYSIGLIYLWRKFSFRLSADGKDGFYLSDRHDVQTRPYTLMNANIQWDLENFTVSLWGRNLTDKDYVVRGFGSFGNDPRKFYITEPYYQFGEPRMVGLDLTWQIN
ncbi:MAG: TonB-dependent receptor, partial [Gammaproteobacteria bacterium]|nr:TonB-dependent receptor [Gammaproteobacteria bacterium]